MSEVLILIGLVIAIISVMLIGFEALVTGRSPWHWPADRRQRRAREHQERLSAMEHELGILPCSLPQCFTCAYKAYDPPWDLDRLCRWHAAINAARNQHHPQGDTTP